MGKKSPFLVFMLTLGIELCDLLFIFSSLVGALNVFGAFDFMASHPHLPIPHFIRRDFMIFCLFLLFSVAAMRVMLAARDGEAFSSERERAFRSSFLLIFAVGILVSCAMAHSWNPFE